MRPVLVFAIMALGIFPASAQVTSTPPAVQTPVTRDSALSREIAQRRDSGDKFLPDADVFTIGDRSIAAGTRVEGPIAVARGNLDIFGTVEGDVFSLGGDVRIHKGARVTGDAWAAAGTVIIDGGVVEGRKRAIPVARPTLPGFTRPEAKPLSTLQSVKLVCAWFAILILIGIGVMVFAEGNLEGVVLALERGFARSFWLGVGGQVAFLPVLLVLVVGLAITVLGVLLIPFAIVSYVIAGAGLVTLGFLAVARLTGGAFASDRGTTSARGVHLRALIIGLVAYLGIWLLAAAFTWHPVAGAVLRAFAMAVTWVAATVGLGATLSSRAGTQRPGAGKKKTTAADDYAWQTPTPVSGVAAATRKTKVSAAS
jgi:hypothetical protein